MSFLEYHLLQEARKNPELAPKVAAIIDIKKEVERAELGWGNTPNLFVSFTAIEKLGINPKSKYDTPLAVYAYPSDYVAKMTSAKSVPFAGRSPHINLFKLKNPGNVLVLSTMNNAAFKAHVQSMRKVYINFYVDELKNDNPYKVSSGESEEARDERFWKLAIDEFEKIVNDSSQNANVEGLGGRFWYISMMVAKDMGQAKTDKKIGSGKETNSDKWYTPPAKTMQPKFSIVDEIPLMWNKLFRMIGIDACIDLGDGIIHGGEPTQCAVFNPAAIEMVDRIKNLDPKNSPSSDSEGKIIKRIGDLMFEPNPESLGKYIVSIFKNNIESGMIGSTRTSWKIGNFYYKEALSDIFYRRTTKNDSDAKIEAIEAAMLSCEVMMRTNQKFGHDLEVVIDDLISNTYVRSATLNSAELWPIIVYLMKNNHEEQANKVLHYILIDNDALSQYQTIIKVCQRYKVEWWNDPDYAMMTAQFDKVFNVDDDPEFYPDWWKVRGGFKKGNV